MQLSHDVWVHHSNVPLMSAKTVSSFLRESQSVNYCLGHIGFFPNNVKC